MIEDRGRSHYKSRQQAAAVSNHVGFPIWRKLIPFREKNAQQARLQPDLLYLGRQSAREKATDSLIDAFAI
jgi:hypothetical protein